MKSSLLLNTLVALGVLLAACTRNKKPVETPPQKAIDRIVGSYVSEEYNQRNEGYDWVGVRVAKQSDSTAHISVRSRSDLKKPTCFLDLDAVLINDSTLEGSYNQATLRFAFPGKSLSISAAEGAPAWALSWPCSGGATLDSYTFVKTAGELDSTQVDQRVFFKSVMYGNYIYFVTVTEDTAACEPFGFASMEMITIPLSGQLVIDAEAGDLNNDGFPELVLFTKPTDSNTLNLIGYSPNNGHSFSMFAWKPVSQHPDLSAGFKGYDEMSIVENTLVQRFPIFDPDGIRTGKIRQIQYKLEEGEAMRQLKISNVIEY